LGESRKIQSNNERNPLVSEGEQSNNAMKANQSSEIQGTIHVNSAGNLKKLLMIEAQCE
jgi:hypothetical protein